VGDYVIVAEGLVKKFGDLVAVDHVSFRVRRGEVFGFLGPNGAGKTTTIHILATLIKPTAGRAYVAGYDVVGEPARVRSVIGIVFQDPSLDDQLTAYENLYIHGRIYGVRGGVLEERIREALRFVELEKFRDKPVKTFSGGMRRRLEIARALIHEPEILFLDEPTLGLDPQTRARIWDYIRALRKERGVTIFLTTHYMDEAESLSDRIAVIDHGRIIAEGTPEDLKSLVGDEVVYVRLPVQASREACIDGDYVVECRIIGSTVMYKVKRAAEAIPAILGELAGRGVRVESVEYRRPTLNDAFLYLTGREIREEEAGGFELLRQVARRRWWR